MTNWRQAESLWQDLRYATQMLRKSPGFTVTAVLTLALGIGANTAIFSVIYGLLLKPLPYHEPRQLVTLWERSAERGIEQDRVSGPDYLDWRAQNTVFSDMAASPGWEGSQSFNLVLRNGTTKIHATYTSASLFATLATKPLLGRPLLTPEDQRGGERSAVLSYDLWQQYFAGDPKAVGQTLTLDSYGRREYTIVGVMPPGFGAPGQCELWLPMGWMGVTLTERRSAHWHTVIARLKPGITLEQARTQMNAIQARLKQSYPGETIGSEVAVVPLLEQVLGRNLRAALLVLWAAAAGVLLIACANVAGLMLARAASRNQEMAVRFALGAGRWRVMRQLLIESLLLAALGGAFGSALGWWGLRLFLAVSPGNIPRLNQVTLDLTALTFTLAISVLTGVSFGIVPAAQFSRPDLSLALNEGARAVSLGRAAGRMRNLLIVAEVAVSLVLLFGAGLMLQSFGRMLRAARGFQPEHLLTAELDFSVSGFTTWVQPTATRPQVPLRELIERLRAHPGVQAAGAGSRLLRRDNHPPGQTIAIYGRPALEPEEQPKAEFQGITPDWLRALGGSVLRGRDFSEADTLDAPGVMLINQTLARRYFAGEDPIGQHLKAGASQPPLDATNVYGQREWSTIVGIVGDVKSLDPHPEAVPEVYVPYWQWPMQSPTILLRATTEPLTLAAAVRRETKTLIPNLPPPVIRSMDDLLSETLAQPRLESRLLTLFAGLALVLAMVGLYGVLAYIVAQRTREIGVRMAFGAQERNVLVLVVGQGLKLTLAGIIAGLLLASLLARALRSLFYGLEAADPRTLACVSLLLVTVSLIACWLPARRAAAIDPIQALRRE
ncbi:MAG TPA: ABC transporter permease [Bryobacteraceae bacterium]|nr:ABC transporter permease [Bryobacteraceae bacterium]